MYDNIRTIFDRPQQDGRRDRIVDDQRNTVFVGYASQPLNIANVSCRITDAFAKDPSGPLIDQLFYCAGLIRLRETDGDALIRQNMSEQCVGGAVELWNRYDVA